MNYTISPHFTDTGTGLREVIQHAQSHTAEKRWSQNSTKPRSGSRSAALEPSALQFFTMPAKFDNCCLFNEHIRYNKTE